MCFSTEASFAGGVIIAAIGIVTIKKVHKPSQIVFATIPLFFGLQQITEGFVWFILQHSAYTEYLNLASYGFLILAQVFWPVMIPLAVLTMEVNKKKRKYLWGLLGMGILLSSFYVVCLFMLKVVPVINGYHIEYLQNFPNAIQLPAFAIYLFASITPLFISSIKRTHLMGILMSLSCLVSIIFFTQYLTSVWCFFAAFISLIILWILRDAKKVHVRDNKAKGFSHYLS